MINTRLIAIKVLVGVLDNNKHPKDAMEQQSSLLDRRDRAFVMEIVYGVLRYRDTLDWILKQFLQKPGKLGRFTFNNLRIGIYQILFMRVPDFAVVNESVEIEKTKGLPAKQTKGKTDVGKSAKPQLVNAVLRNILRKKDNFTLPLQPDNPVLKIALNTSHPKWLIEKWINRFGEEEAMKCAQANNGIPPFTIRSNSLRTTRDKLLQKLEAKGIISEPTKFSPDGIVLKNVCSYEDLSFVYGLFTIQDEASQLIAFLLDPKPGDRILDACAAPGGKTTHIAQLIRDRGELIAVEKERQRLNRLHENIQNFGLKSVKIINVDITDLKDSGTFDRILVDAPCSSLGVIRRNPDVKYRRKAKDLNVYKSNQIRLLRAVSTMLKKEGMLVYSVCSTEPEEGEEVVDEFLKTSKDFRIIDNETVFLNNFINKGIFRTYPYKHNMDGFFGVKLCRKD